MQSARTEAIFEKILAAMRRRMALEASSAPESLGEIFSAIAQTFDTADFTVSAVERSTGLTRRQRAEFSAATGSTIDGFARRYKWDFAAGLLSQTSLDGCVIAERLHYTASNFTRAFTTWFGQSPKEYREASWGGRKYLARPDPGKAIRLRAGLCAPRAIFGSEGGMLGKVVVRALWEVLRDETHAMQELLLRQGKIRVATDFLFELLSQQSREAGHRGGERCVSLARLALASVEGYSIHEPRHSELAALALARLGDAHRLSGAPCKAEKSFTLARARLEGSGSQLSHRVCAEINLLEGTLRASQRRFDAALPLLDAARRFARESGTGELLERAILRLSLVRWSQGRFDQVVATLRELEQVLLERSNPDWCGLVLVYEELTLAYLELDDDARAGDTVGRARAMIARGEHSPFVLNSRIFPAYWRHIS